MPFIYYMAYMFSILRLPPKTFLPYVGCLFFQNVSFLYVMHISHDIDEVIR
jgi:glycopeptide antibiotics resistance protein